MTTAFQERVWKLAEKVPKGRVTTYKEVARALHKPHATRAVGNALNKSPGMPHCPCHRVVRSDGSVGGFASGTKAKIRLLESEGIRIKGGKVDSHQFYFFK